MMSANSFIHRQTARREINTWLIPIGALILLGFGAWIYQLTQGLIVTGMRDVISWGAYIVTFAFFVGLSAGGLIVASSAEVFDVQALKPLSRLGVLTALSAISCAALMIIPDLGRADRILNLLIHPQWRSPLVWDVCIITAYLLFSVVDLTVLHRLQREPSRWTKTARVLAYIGLPTAVLLHSITAWIFGLQVARTWWNTALMAPLFVVSAMLSGTALVALVAFAAERFDHVKLPQRTWRMLTGLILVSLCVDLFLVASDYITILWGNVPRERAALNLILPGGSWQVVFWLEWVVGGLVPFLLLAIPRLRASRGLNALAALFVMVGIYAYRIELIVGGMVRPLVQSPPGIAQGSYREGTSSFVYTGSYHPSWIEIFVVVGMFSLLVALITIGYQKLKVMSGVTPESDSDSQPSPVAARS